jgi:AcrR family transcriptional regulator
MDAAIKYRTPLRQAQRDLTRSRIVNAARTLFYEKHYDTATMDEIAAAAGLRRSTLYLHYRDKSEILLELITEYGEKARQLLATLPGPDPSLQEIGRWVDRIARFIAKERMPLSIIVEVRRKHAYGPAMDKLTEELLLSLGQNNPQFRNTTGAAAEPLRRARALMLLQELIYACETYLEDRCDPCGQALLQVVAEDIYACLNALPLKK